MSGKKTKIKDLIPDDQNFNAGTEFGGGLIEKSLSKFGAGRSILIDKHNRIIAGNKTVENAAAIGLDDVQIVETDGKTIIAVKRTDIDLDTKRGREMALADNATAKANISWDAAAITEWEMPAAEWGIDLAVTVEPPQEDEAAAAETINKAAELQKKWGTATGQLWRLGEHRLVCGDSTNEATVKRLLDGETPNLMVTDPPYGVEYDAEWRKEAGIKHCENNSVGIVHNDDNADWLSAWLLSPANVAYVWSSDRKAYETVTSIIAAGYEVRGQIIWAKEQGVISRGHYNPQHEPCWYAVRSGATADWCGDNKQTTLWQINKSNRSDTGHSTQKPVECMSRAIQNHEGDVYDPFSGSGTTLIACEQLNRRCFAVEIAPEYVAVALERWHNLTGKTPELIEDAAVAAKT